MLPLPLMLQVTAVLEVPETVAMKVWLWPTGTLTAGGVTITAMGCWGLVLAQPSRSRTGLRARRSKNTRRMKDLALAGGGDSLSRMPVSESKGLEPTVFYWILRHRNKMLGFGSRLIGRVPSGHLEKEGWPDNESQSKSLQLGPTPISTTIGTASL